MLNRQRTVSASSVAGARFDSLHKSAERARLATAARIVQRYGGKIWVNSTTGKGTIFHFTLPAATARRELAARSTESGARLTEVKH